jgi:hypothetical protein
MKNPGLIWLILIVFSGLLISCEEESKPKKYFKYNGKTYKLDRGFFLDWQKEENGSYDYDIWFISPSIKVDPLTDLFSGVGEIIYLDMNTSSEQGFVGGTYNFAEERLPFTFVGGTVGIDADVQTEEGTILYITGGTIDITVLDNGALIEFTLDTNTGKSITGKFRGNLDELSL